MEGEQTMTRIYAVSAAVLVAALLGGLAFFVLVDRGGDQFAHCYDSSVTVAGDTLGGAFEMVDHTGRTVTDEDIITRPSLLYFGYTFCPDVCPIDVDRNAIAVDIAQERGYDVQPVFISIDPQRDTPEILDLFVHNMHPDMIGLTGTEDQVRQTAQAYRAFYRRHDELTSSITSSITRPSAIWCCPDTELSMSSGAIWRRTRLPTRWAASSTRPERDRTAIKLTPARLGPIVGPGLNGEIARHVRRADGRSRIGPIAAAGR
jgi:protein SCO1